ncbi:DNRLRE domain-containing protein [Marinilongibacter aquaticus]|uniref:DNRLRE domain-containing protein n=1 Tax=Marinilongibacter aquaticus TaxID=2975157 RepID=UPI0021BD3C62|nr:DNRLRE domain-containing protein [Marinilongibacter aquaticus]UBM58907.1 DNRLRE domain-containing protein [Marinilongibacter aquaticus]
MYKPKSLKALCLFSLCFVFIHYSAQAQKKSPRRSITTLSENTISCETLSNYLGESVEQLTATPNFEFSAVVDNTSCFTTYPSTNYGCLNSYDNQSWFVVHALENGDIRLNITNSNNYDIDATLWASLSADYSNLENVLASTPVSCDYTIYDPQISIQNVVAGNYYLLVITNFSNDNTKIKLGAKAGSSAFEYLYKCPSSLAVSEPLQVDMNLHAETELIATSPVQTDRARFSAGREIQLNPGFSVNKGQVFKANVANCFYKGKVLVLQPGPEEGKDSHVNSIEPLKNSADDTFLDPYAWSQSYGINIKRAYLEFPFSQMIPEAKIDSAFLYLYFSQELLDAYVTFDGHSGNNEMTIKRITQPWSEATINWYNKPSSTTVNQVIVPAAQYKKQNYPHIDVTALVQDMQNNSNYGFEIRHSIEDIFKITCLTSSDSAYPSIRPKLVIYYSYL